MKLCGEELDNALKDRHLMKERRREQRMTIRAAAKSLGMKPSDYLAFEYGQDICPHEYVETQIGGVHPPFIVLEMCSKCKHVFSHRSLEEEIQRRQETS